MEEAPLHVIDALCLPSVVCREPCVARVVHYHEVMFARGAPLRACEADGLQGEMSGRGGALRDLA